MKRLVALLLVLALSVCLFTACAQSTTETTAPAPETTPASSETTTEAAPADEQTTEAVSGAPDFTGTTVNALIFKSLDTDYIIETLAPRLKAETGIELVVNQVPYEEVRAAQLADANGAQQYDIINPCTEWSYEYRQFSAPIDEYIGKEGYPDIERDDLIDFVFQGFNPTGETYFIPYQPDTRVFFFREDLLAEEGLEVPQTWDELLEAAKRLTKDTDGDGKIDQYGFVFSAQRGWNLTLVWVPFMFSAGGELFDGTQPVFNSQAGLDAINFLKELKQYCPPDLDAYGEYEVNAAAVNGTAAMGVSASSITPEIEAETSPVKGLMGTAEFPVQTAGFTPKYSAGMGGWAFGVSNYSKVKDAAAYTLMWLTSKDIVTEMEIHGRMHASRYSEASNEELLAVNPHVSTIVDVLAKSKIFYEGVEGAAIGELVNLRISQAVSGEMDAQEALDLAAQECSEYLANN